MMMSKTFRSLMAIFGLVLMYQSPAQAQSTEDYVNSYLNSQYYSASAPGYYKYQSQGARLLSAGGFSYRVPPSRPIQLYDVDTPRLSASCSGIDFYGGAIWHIELDKLIQQITTAIAQLPMALAMVAIQIISPQFNAIMQWLEGLINTFSSIDINACQMANQAMSGMRQGMEQHMDCVTGEMDGNGNKNFAQAFQECAAEGGADQRGKNLSGFTQGNIVWFTLYQNGSSSFFGSSDLTLAEVIMNLTGTVIVTTLDTRPNPEIPCGDSPLPDCPDIDNIRIDSKHLASPIGKEGMTGEAEDGLWKVLIEGSGSGNPQIEIFQCAAGTRTADKLSCLTLTSTRQTVTLSSNVTSGAGSQQTTAQFRGLKEKIKESLVYLVDAIKNDTALLNNSNAPINAQAGQAIGLVNAATVPIYRYISAVTALMPYAPSDQIVDENLDQFAYALAHDVLTKAVEDMVGSVRELVNALPRAQREDQHIKKWLEDAAYAQNGLAMMRKENKKEMAKLIEVYEQIREYEKTLISRLGSGIVAKTLWNANG